MTGLGDLPAGAAVSTLGFSLFDLELEKSNTTIAHRIGEGVINHDPHFQISWIHG